MLVLAIQNLIPISEISYQQIENFNKWIDVRSNFL